MRNKAKAMWNSPKRPYVQVITGLAVAAAGSYILVKITKTADDIVA